MSRAAWIVAASVLGAWPAQPADRDFSDVVRAIGEQLHAKPQHIPLFGLVNLYTAAAHPAGTKHIELATFENVHYLHGYQKSIPESVRAAVGESWKPFIHVRSEHDRETVLVYMRETGHNCKLLIVSMEDREATVVEILLDIDGLSRWIDDPEHSARHWNH